MKLAYIFFLFSALFFHQGQSGNIAQIQFNTFTRGGNESVLITKDSILVSDKPRSTQTISVKCKIKKEDWRQLREALNKVNLDEIELLRSPSNRRQVDGAWHSEIIIVTTQQKSLKHSFDDENPNEKLRPLMQMIRQLHDKYSAAPK